jgi:hypothetical protein
MTQSSRHDRRAWAIRFTCTFERADSTPAEGMWKGTVQMMGGLRADLARAIGADSVLTGFRRSLLAVSATLRPDETALASSVAGRRSVEAGREQSGLVIVTDQRLLFVRPRLLSQSIDAIPLAHIAGLTTRVGSTSGSMVVSGADIVTTEFVDLPNLRLTRIVNAIREQLDPGSTASERPLASRAASSATAVPGDALGRDSVSDASSGLAEQIQKLAALHLAGELTDAEFTAAKARLISG